MTETDSFVAPLFTKYRMVVTTWPWSGSNYLEYVFFSRKYKLTRSAAYYSNFIISFSKIILNEKTACFEVNMCID